MIQYMLSFLSQGDFWSLVVCCTFLYLLLTESREKIHYEQQAELQTDPVHAETLSELSFDSDSTIPADSDVSSLACADNLSELETFSYSANVHAEAEVPSPDANQLH